MYMALVYIMNTPNMSVFCLHNVPFILVLYLITICKAVLLCVFFLFTQQHYKSSEWFEVSNELCIVNYNGQQCKSLWCVIDEFGCVHVIRVSVNIDRFLYSIQYNNTNTFVFTYITFFFLTTINLVRFQSHI